MTLNKRIAISIIIGLSITVLSFLSRPLISSQPWDGDFHWPLCAGKMILDGADPYSCFGAEVWTRFPSNPYTTALIALPFTFFGLLSAPLMFGLWSGLLAYGLLQQTNKVWPLLMFTGAPFWHAFYFLQWTPLLAAVYVLPVLLPLALVKPQIGFPILFTRFTWKRAIMCMTFLVLTFVLDPTWPVRWWPQAKSYDGFIPVLWTPFGLLLVTGAMFWRYRETQLFLLYAAMPQRAIYDTLLLYFTLKTKNQFIIYTVIGWIVLISFYLVGQGLNRPLWIVCGFYIPVLVFVFINGFQASQQAIKVAYQKRS